MIDPLGTCVILKIIRKYYNNNAYFIYQNAYYILEKSSDNNIKQVVNGNYSTSFYLFKPVSEKVKFFHVC